MLSGFNTNFRYRGVLFHVQTEDSGRENPHVITHLFYGGNILASEKNTYGDLLGGDDGALEDEVRKRMESQHKAMLKGLSKGDHNKVIAERLGPDVLDPAPEAADTPSVSPAPPAASPTSSPATPPAAPPPAASLESSPAASAEHGSASQTQPAMAAVVTEAASKEGSAPNTAARLSRVFGDRVVSEKPLDEVVLDYLVENARKRKRKPQ